MRRGSSRKLTGHAVPVVVVRVGLVAEAFGLGVFGLDQVEPFFGGVRGGHGLRG